MRGVAVSASVRVHFLPLRFTLLALGTLALPWLIWVYHLQQSSSKRDLMRLVPLVNGLVVAAMLYLISVVFSLHSSSSAKQWGNASPFKSAAKFWPFFLAGFAVTYWLAQ